LIYREFDPPPSLSNDVHCFWMIKDTPGRQTPAVEFESVVPDGCVEWIVHFGDAFLMRESDGSLRQQDSSLLAGPTNCPIELQPTGAVGMVGVRFRPGRARYFFPIPWSQLLNNAVSIANISLRDVEETSYRVRETIGHEGKLQLLADRLLKRRTGPKSGDGALDHALDLLNQTRGLMGIAQISRITEQSERTLERRFKSAVGVSPKELARIIRFRTVFDRIDQNQAVNWSQVAARSGFFDQPHLIRDFKHFAGCTPAEFLRRKQPLASCFAGL
jgi:AraC-like DNA-binding protein